MAAIQPTVQPSLCTNCGNPQVDVFCARCGEKQPNPHDLKLGHFAHELVHELVHLDGKLWRTLRELVVRPGQLTVEYLNGQKKRSISPLRLFLTLFAVMFLAYTSIKPVAIYSLQGLMAVDQSGVLEKAFRRSAEKRKLTYEQITLPIEQRWQKNMSLVSMLSIVTIALLLKLLYSRHRRHLTEHLVFATHYMCFTYLMSLALLPVYLAIGMRRGIGNQVLTVVMFAVGSWYIYAALQRVYGQSGAKTLVKSLAVWAVTFGTSMLLMAGSLLAAVFTVLGT